MGIEPTSSAWKAEVLPLNYTRNLSRTRFQPAPPPGQANQTGGGGGRIRTYEGMSQQIYSLPPLAAWVPLRQLSRAFSGFAPWVSMVWMTRDPGLRSVRQTLDLT